MLKNIIYVIAVIISIFTVYRLNRINDASQYINCLNGYIDDNILYTPEIWWCVIKNPTK